MDATGICTTVSARTASVEARASAKAGDNKDVTTGMRIMVHPSCIPTTRIKGMNPGAACLGARRCILFKNPWKRETRKTVYED
jgi:hypothetical protein